MNKNTSLALHIIVILAVAVLYYLHFSAEPKPAAGGSRGLASPNEPIVYVDSDSLLANYDFYKELKKKAEDERKRVDADLGRKEKAFEKSLNEYQQKAASMSNFERQATEQNLGKTQQELFEYKQRVAERLAQQEQEVTIELYDKIADYAKSYSTKTGHKIILAYSKGGGILFVNDSLDITKEIVKGLNKAHKK